jgi:hypothetical protein
LISDWDEVYANQIEDDEDEGEELPAFAVEAAKTQAVTQPTEAVAKPVRVAGVAEPMDKKRMSAAERKKKDAGSAPSKRKQSDEVVSPTTERPLKKTKVAHDVVASNAGFAASFLQGQAEEKDKRKNKKVHIGYS